MNPILLMAGQQQGGGGNPMISTLIMFGMIFVIFYFMILRPQQKRAKERQKMLDSIKKGDKIITSGGMHGKVINVDEKTILIEASDNVKLKFDRSAINVIIREASEEAVK